MTKKHPKTRRLTAFFLLIAFSISNHFSTPLHAAPSVSIPQEKKLSLSALSLPQELGKIEENHLENSSVRPAIILIQDAHAIPEAQKSIEKIMGYFQKHYGIHNVAVEGASAEFDLQILKSFPDRQILKQVMNGYMEKGELPGSMAAAVFDQAGTRYQGIENWPLYEEGIGLYLKAAEKAPFAELKAARENLNRRKQAAYPKDLLEIDQTLESFQRNKSDLTEVLNALAKYKQPEDEALKTVMREMQESGAREKEIENEIRKVTASVNQGPEFNEKFQAYQTSRISAGEFALWLEENAGAKFPRSLSAVIERHKKLRDLQGRAFFNAFEKYAHAVKESLFRNDIQRSLDAESHKLDLDEKLANLELTRSEWEEIKAAGKEKGDEFAAHRAFYENAEKRDGAFVKNLEGLRKSTLLIAGGFHTEGLVRRFKERGIPYALVMPGISSIPENTPYRDLMRGEVSWKNYFRVENGRVNLYKAFMRASRDKLLAAEPEIFKTWRDQIILDLAAQEKMTRAAAMLSLLDETRKENPKPAIPWAVKFERFLIDLGGLHSENNFTEKNILNLLQKTTTLQAAGGAAGAALHTLPAAFFSLAKPDTPHGQDGLRSEARSSGEKNYAVEETLNLKHEKERIFYLKDFADGFLYKFFRKFEGDSEKTFRYFRQIEETEAWLKAQRGDQRSGFGPFEEWDKRIEALSYFISGKIMSREDLVDRLNRRNPQDFYALELADYFFLVIYEGLKRESVTFLELYNELSASLGELKKEMASLFPPMEEGAEPVQYDASASIESAADLNWLYLNRALNLVFDTLPGRPEVRVEEAAPDQQAYEKVLRGEADPSKFLTAYLAANAYEISDALALQTAWKNIFSAELSWPGFLNEVESWMHSGILKRKEDGRQFIQPEKLPADPNDILRRIPEAGQPLDLGSLQAKIPPVPDLKLPADSPSLKGRQSFFIVAFFVIGLIVLSAIQAYRKSTPPPAPPAPAVPNNPKNRNEVRTALGLVEKSPDRNWTLLNRAVKRGPGPFSMRSEARSDQDLLKDALEDLGDKSPVVRRQALLTLAALGKAAAGALEQIQKLSSDPHPDVRNAASYAVQRIEGEAAELAPASRTAEISTTPAKRTPPARAARTRPASRPSGAGPEIPRHTQNMIRSLNTGDVEARRRAAKDLGEDEEPLTVLAAYQALKEAATNDDDTKTRRLAVTSMAKNKAVAPATMVRDFEKILTEDKELNVKRAAIEALKKMGLEGQAVTAIFLANRDADPSIRGDIAVALAGLGPQVEEELINRFAAEPDAFVRERIVQALRKSGSDAAVRALWRAVDDPVFAIQKAALDYVGVRPGLENQPERILLVVRLFRDPKPEAHQLAYNWFQVRWQMAIIPAVFEQIAAEAQTNEKARGVVQLLATDRKYDLAIQAIATLKPTGSSEARSVSALTGPLLSRPALEIEQLTLELQNVQSGEPPVSLRFASMDGNFQFHVHVTIGKRLTGAFYLYRSEKGLNIDQFFPIGQKFTKSYELYKGRGVSRTILNWLAWELSKRPDWVFYNTGTRTLALLKLYGEFFNLTRNEQDVRKLISQYGFFNQNVFGALRLYVYDGDRNRLAPEVEVRLTRPWFPENEQQYKIAVLNRLLPWEVPFKAGQIIKVKSNGEIENKTGDGNFYLLDDSSAPIKVKGKPARWETPHGQIVPRAEARQAQRRLLDLAALAANRAETHSGGENIKPAETNGPQKITAAPPRPSAGVRTPVSAGSRHEARAEREWIYDKTFTVDQSEASESLSGEYRIRIEKPAAGRLPDSANIYTKEGGRIISIMIRANGAWVLSRSDETQSQAPVIYSLNDGARNEGDFHDLRHLYYQWDAVPQGTFKALDQAVRETGSSPESADFLSWLQLNFLEMINAGTSAIYPDPVTAWQPFDVAASTIPVGSIKPQIKELNHAAFTADATGMNILQIYFGRELIAQGQAQDARPDEEKVFADALATLMRKMGTDALLSAKFRLNHEEDFAEGEGSLLIYLTLIGPSRAEARAAKPVDLAKVADHIIDLFEKKLAQKRIPSTTLLKEHFPGTIDKVKLRKALLERVERKSEPLQRRIARAVRIEQNVLAAAAETLLEMVTANPDGTPAPIDIAREMGIDASGIKRNFTFIISSAKTLAGKERNLDPRVMDSLNEMSRAEARAMEAFTPVADGNRGRHLTLQQIGQRSFYEKLPGYPRVIFTPNFFEFLTLPGHFLNTGDISDDLVFSQMQDSLSENYAGRKFRLDVVSELTRAGKTPVLVISLDTDHPEVEINGLERLIQTKGGPFSRKTLNGERRARRMWPGIQKLWPELSDAAKKDAILAVLSNPSLAHNFLLWLAGDAETPGEWDRLNANVRDVFPAGRFEELLTAYASDWNYRAAWVLVDRQWANLPVALKRTVYAVLPNVLRKVARQQSGRFMEDRAALFFRNHWSGDLAPQLVQDVLSTVLFDRDRKADLRPLWEAVSNDDSGLTTEARRLFAEDLLQRNILEADQETFRSVVVFLRKQEGKFPASLREATEAIPDARFSVPLTLQHRLESSYVGVQGKTVKALVEYFLNAFPDLEYYQLNGNLELRGRVLRGEQPSFRKLLSSNGAYYQEMANTQVPQGETFEVAFRAEARAQKSGSGSISSRASLWLKYFLIYTAVLAGLLLLNHLVIQILMLTFPLVVGIDEASLLDQARDYYSGRFQEEVRIIVQNTPESKALRPAFIFHFVELPQKFIDKALSTMQTAIAAFFTLRTLIWSIWKVKARLFKRDGESPFWKKGDYWTSRIFWMGVASQAAGYAMNFADIYFFHGVADYIRLPGLRGVYSPGDFLIYVGLILIPAGILGFVAQLIFEFPVKEKIVTEESNRSEARAAKPVDLAKVADHIIDLFEKNLAQKRIPSTTLLKEHFPGTIDKVKLRKALRERVERKSEPLQRRIARAVRIEQNVLAAAAETLLEMVMANPDGGPVPADIAREMGIDASVVKRNFTFIISGAKTLAGKERNLDPRVMDRLNEMSRAEARQATKRSRVPDSLESSRAEARAIKNAIPAAVRNDPDKMEALKARVHSSLSFERVLDLQHKQRMVSSGKENEEPVFDKWSYNATPLSVLDEKFSAVLGGTLFQTLLKRAKEKEKLGKKLFVLDWGAGDLTALRELDLLFQEAGQTNVEFVGFSRTVYVNQFKTLLNHPRIHLVLDVSENLAGYFKPGEELYGHNPDVIFGHQSIAHLLIETEPKGRLYTEHANALAAILNEGGFIVHDLNWSSREQFNHVKPNLNSSLNANVVWFSKQQTDDWARREQAASSGVVLMTRRAEARRSAENILASFQGHSENFDAPANARAIAVAGYGEFKLQAYAVLREALAAVEIQTGIEAGSAFTALSKLDHQIGIEYSLSEKDLEQLGDNVKAALAKLVQAAHDAAALNKFVVTRIRVPATARRWLKISDHNRKDSVAIEAVEGGILIYNPQIGKSGTELSGAPVSVQITTATVPQIAVLYSDHTAEGESFYEGAQAADSPAQLYAAALVSQSISQKTLELLARAQGIGEGYRVKSLGVMGAFGILVNLMAQARSEQRLQAAA